MYSQGMDGSLHQGPAGSHARRGGGDHLFEDEGRSAVALRSSTGRNWN